jgi:hypothetical protein
MSCPSRHPPNTSSPTPSPTHHPLSFKERITVATIGVVLAITAAVAVLSRVQLGFFMLVFAATIPWIVVLSRLRFWKGWPWVVVVMISGGFMVAAGVVFFKSTASPTKALSSSTNTTATVPAPDSPASQDCHEPNRKR